MSKIYELLSVKFSDLKMCECKTNDKYQVCTRRQPGASSRGGASQTPRPKQDAVEEQYYDSEPLGVTIVLLFCPQEHFGNIFTQIQKIT